MDWDVEAGTGWAKRINTSSASTLVDLAANVFMDANEVRGADFDGFTQALNGHFYPARVEPLDSSSTLVSPTLSAVHLKHLTIAYVRFGAAARVDPGDIHAYHVNVPLRGMVLSSCGDQRISASPSQAAVFSPHAHTQLPAWDADATQLCIKLDRATVDSELGAVLGRSLADPIDFQLGFDLTGAGGRRWLSLLSALLLHCDADDAAAGESQPLIEMLERSLVSGLVLNQPHSYSDLLHAPADTRSPRAVRDVIDLIEESPEGLFTVGDLARHANLSARALQSAFQRDLGTTPMRYLRQVRLERVREDLLLGRGRVSEVAHHWGFTNLGRFAASYQDRFGELPSETTAR